MDRASGEAAFHRRCTFRSRLHRFGVIDIVCTAMGKPDAARARAEPALHPADRIDLLLKSCIPNSGTATYRADGRGQLIRSQIHQDCVLFFRNLLKDAYS
jgi:hypothetical protein